MDWNEGQQNWSPDQGAGSEEPHQHENSPVEEALSEVLGDDQQKEEEQNQQEREEEPAKENRRPQPSTRSRQGLFSRADVEDIVSFVRIIDEIPDDSTRRHVSFILGWDGDDADPLDLAFSLQTNVGLRIPFETYAELVRGIKNNSLGWSQAAQIGARIADMSDTGVKNLIRLHNYFTNSDVRFRKTMSNTDIIDAIADGAPSVTDETISAFETVETLFTLWPGDR